VFCQNNYISKDQVRQLYHPTYDSRDHQGLFQPGYNYRAHDNEEGDEAESTNDEEDRLSADDDAADDDEDEDDEQAEAEAESTNDEDDEEPNEDVVNDQLDDVGRSIIGESVDDNPIHEELDLQGSNQGDTISETTPSSVDDRSPSFQLIARIRVYQLELLSVLLNYVRDYYISTRGHLALLLLFWLLRELTNDHSAALALLIQHCPSGLSASCSHTLYHVAIVVCVTVSLAVQVSERLVQPHPSHICSYTAIPYHLRLQSMAYDEWMLYHNHLQLTLPSCASGCDLITTSSTCCC
jgi:hypothetical protein